MVWFLCPGLKQDRDQGVINPAGPGKTGSVPTFYLGLRYKLYLCLLSSNRMSFYTQTLWQEGNCLKTIEGLLFVS